MCNMKFCNNKELCLENVSNLQQYTFQLIILYIMGLHKATRKALFFEVLEACIFYQPKQTSLLPQKVPPVTWSQL